MQRTILERGRDAAGTFDEAINRLGEKEPPRPAARVMQVQVVTPLQLEQFFHGAFCPTRARVNYEPLPEQRLGHGFEGLVDAAVDGDLVVDLTEYSSDATLSCRIDQWHRQLSQI